jgi:predicted metal-dependent peptidase
MNAAERVRRAFDNIYDRHPYFASIVASWTVSYFTPTGTWQPGDMTAATNGPKLYINPDFIETLNIAETTDLMLHEAGHVFLGHHLRFSNVKDPREWNIAADLGLNDYIMPYLDHTGKIYNEGLFPGRGPFADLPTGKDAEWYFDKVRQSRPKMPQPQQGGQGSKGQGTSQGQRGQQSSGAGQPQQGQAQAGGSGGAKQEGKPEGKGKANGDKTDEKSENEGEGSGNGPQPIPNTRPDLPQSIGDILPYPLGEDEDMDEVQREWEQKIAQGVQDAAAIGNLPGWIKELAEELYGHKSKLDWKLILRRFLTKNVPMGGTSFERLNRRQAYRARTILVPSNRSRQASNGVILVDTSGSMNTTQCDLALSEVEKILKTFPRCEVTMMMADTRLIEGSERVFHRSDFPLKVPQEWMGRGGTDLSEAILEVGKMAKRRNWKWFLVVSDMYWAATRSTNPGIPTIFVWTPMGQEAEPYARAPYGQLIGPIEAK